MAADLFELPGDSLLARGTADPIEQLQLTRAEADQLSFLQGEANSARTLAEVGLVLGASFLLYREVVRRKTLAELANNTVDSPVLHWLAKRNAGRFILPWVRTVTPALETAYTIGAVKTGAMVPDEMVREFATKYAVDTATYFNETSAQALTEGFNVYVNRNLPARLAAEKALQGYGLNSRMMRALVGRAARNKVDSPLRLNHDASTHDFIESMLVQRAYDIGDNEGFNVSQHGQQITWLYLQKTGRLSMSALKVWHTARDERVCASCGPLDKQAVLVNQPFKTNYGSLWVPSMHPNCRCEVRLRAPLREEFLLSKADGPPDQEFERQHPRGQGGRFRRITRQPTFAEPEIAVETDVERALREARERPAVEEEVSIPTGVEIPSELQIPGDVSIAGEVQIPGAVSIPEEQAEVSIAGPEIAQAEETAATIPSGPPREVISITGLTPVEIDQIVQDLQIAAGEQLSIRMAGAPRPATSAPVGVVPLMENVYRLDPTGFHYQVEQSPHIDPNEPDFAFFGPEDHFLPLDDVTEQIGTMYAREIAAETRRIMSDRRNFIRELGMDDIPPAQLAKEIKLAITAEILGQTDSDDEHHDFELLRARARAMGVRREDWIVYEYRMDHTYDKYYMGEESEFRDTDVWSVPGRYRITGEELLPATGWPVIVAQVEPEIPEEEVPDRDWPYA